MENYCKVMTPFVKNIRRRSNNSLEIVQNPYTKAKLVKYYEILAKRLLMLKSSIIAMNNEFFQLTEKYYKLYEQHVRNQNNNLTAVLLQTEDELNVMKSKVEETVNVYKDAVLAIAQQQSMTATTAALAHGDAVDEDVRPKETTGVRLSRVLRRVQFLQEKLKSGHIVHGPGNQTAAVN